MSAVRKVLARFGAVLLVVIAFTLLASFRAWEQRERELFASLEAERQHLQGFPVASVGALHPVWRDSLDQLVFRVDAGGTAALCVVEAIENIGRMSRVEITSISIARDSVVARSSGIVALRLSSRGGSAATAGLLRMIEEHRPLLRIAEISITQLNPMPRPGEADEAIVEAVVEAMVRMESPKQRILND